MSDQSLALRRIKAQSDLSLDRTFTPLAAAATALVLRYATERPDGLLLLTRAARVRLLVALDGLLATAEPAIAAVILAGITRAITEASRPFGARPTAVPAVTRTEVREQLQRARGGLLSQVDTVVLAAVANGRDATIVASVVSEYLSPVFTNRRSVSGKMLRADRVGIKPSWPAASGAGSTPARRIAATEVSKAYGDHVIVLAQREPGWVLRWDVSIFHDHVDECTRNSERDVGLGPGVFPANALPEYPAYPRCCCSIQPVRIADL